MEIDLLLGEVVVVTEKEFLRVLAFLEDDTKLFSGIVRLLDEAIGSLRRLLGCLVL